MSTALRQTRPQIAFFQLGFLGNNASSRVLKLHMASWKFLSEEFVLRSLIASPSIKPFLTPGGWQNRWPAEFTNLKSVVGGCCCTYVAQSASYSCSCTEPFILYELHSGKSYHPLDYGLVTLAKPYTYKVNLYKLSTFYKMNRLNQNNACLVTLIGHI